MTSGHEKRKGSWPGPKILFKKLNDRSVNDDRSLIPDDLEKCPGVPQTFLGGGDTKIMKGLMKYLKQLMTG